MTSRGVDTTIFLIFALISCRDLSPEDQAAITRDAFFQNHSCHIHASGESVGYSCTTRFQLSEYVNNSYPLTEGHTITVNGLPMTLADEHGSFPAYYMSETTVPADFSFVWTLSDGVTLTNAIAPDTLQVPSITSTIAPDTPYSLTVRYTPQTTATSTSASAYMWISDTTGNPTTTVSATVGTPTIHQDGSTTVSLTFPASALAQLAGTTTRLVVSYSKTLDLTEAGAPGGQISLTQAEEQDVTISEAL